LTGGHPSLGLSSAYTMGSACASFEEESKGSIEVGKLADMAVISDDLFALNPADIEKTKVVMTVFDGRIVHDAIRTAALRSDPAARP
jgi:predicted amidohydrolase YtcJ